MNLKNKNILITGASSGIGKSFAGLLAEKGANLVLVARNKSALEEIADTLQQKYKVKVQIIQKDLSVPHAAMELYDAVKSQSLNIDILINNAGFGKWGKFETFTQQEYEEMIQLNITSLTELCYYFIPGFLQKNEAGIINVGSTASFMPIPYSAVYGATKSYVLSFTEALVGELSGSGITVTCLCPGGTESNFSAVANANNNNNLNNEPLMSSDEVARLGLEAFLAKKHYVITGRKMQIRFLRLLSRKKVIDTVASFWKKRLNLQ